MACEKIRLILAAHYHESCFAKMFTPHPCASLSTTRDYIQRSTCSTHSHMLAHLSCFFFFIFFLLLLLLLLLLGGSKFASLSSLREWFVLLWVDECKATSNHAIAVGQFRKIIIIIAQAHLFLHTKQARSHTHRETTTAEYNFLNTIIHFILLTTKYAL